MSKMRTSSVMASMLRPESRGYRTARRGRSFWGSPRSDWKPTRPLLRGHGKTECSRILSARYGYSRSCPIRTPTPEADVARQTIDRRSSLCQYEHRSGAGAICRRTDRRSDYRSVGNAGLFVIARNSSFAFRGKSVDARRIASDLGVRYLLEGSARRAAGRVRINASSLIQWTAVICGPSGSTGIWKMFSLYKMRSQQR